MLCLFSRLVNQLSYHRNLNYVGGWCGNECGLGGFAWSFQRLQIGWLIETVFLKVIQLPITSVARWVSNSGAELLWKACGAERQFLVPAERLCSFGCCWLYFRHTVCLYYFASPRRLFCLVASGRPHSPTLKRSRFRDLLDKTKRGQGDAPERPHGDASPWMQARLVHFILLLKLYLQYQLLVIICCCFSFWAQKQLYHSLNSRKLLTWLHGRLSSGKEQQIMFTGKQAEGNNNGERVCAGREAKQGTQAGKHCDSGMGLQSKTEASCTCGLYLCVSDVSRFTVECIPL